MSISQEQLNQLEKNAGLMRALYEGGKLVAKPIEYGLRGAGAVLSPAVSVAGKTLKGVGNVANTAMSRIGLPIMGGAAKVVGGTAAGAGAAGAGAAASVGKGIHKGFIAPMASKYTNLLKEHPIGTPLVTGLTGMGAYDILKRSTHRPYTNSPENYNSYENLKQRYTKVGHDMNPEEQISFEKAASALDAIKKGIQFGGTLPSIAGIAAAASLPYLMKPTLESSGHWLQRQLYPLDERIKADEEIAKKQLGIIAAHQADQMLGQQKAMSKSFQDMPKLESNLEILIQKDPIIADVVAQDPGKRDDLRETMETVYDFAPDIATNRQAAQSILREAAMSPDGGLNYNTIKLIADAQKSITGGR